MRCRPLVGASALVAVVSGALDARGSAQVLQPQPQSLPQMVTNLSRDNSSAFGLLESNLSNTTNSTNGTGSANGSANRTSIAVGESWGISEDDVSVRPGTPIGVLDSGYTVPTPAAWQPYGPDAFHMVYTDYLCKGSMDALSNNTCGVAPNSNRVASLLEELQEGDHLLVYGPSWVREVAQTLLMVAEWKQMLITQEYLGEQTDSKTCFCTLEGTPCECADFTRYHFQGNKMMTVVINYENLQSPEHVNHLNGLLFDTEYNLTRAIVMEPHAPCFFNATCPAAGELASPGNQPGPGKPDTWYGCEWSDVLWEVMRARFPTPKSLVHLVPWNVPPDHGINAADIALRTRSVVKPYQCEPTLFTREDGAFDITRPGVINPTISDLHQCLFVCSSEIVNGTKVNCHPGSPFAVTSEALLQLGFGEQPPPSR